MHITNTVQYSENAMMMIPVVRYFRNGNVEMMKKNSDLMWVANVYWYLDEVSCVLVLRNKLWFNGSQKTR